VPDQKRLGRREGAGRGLEPAQGRGVRLRDKVVLLTGASSGIGWETAKAFASRGAKLALAARREDKLRELSGLIGGAVETLVIPCDVSQPSQGREAVARTVALFGKHDVLVNNAGIMATRRFHQQDLEEIESVMRTNYTGAAALIQAALPGMLTAKSGHVVNVASMAGVMGLPYMAAYCASKHALVGLTESLRREYRGTGVTFSAVCPGSVDTPMASDNLKDEKLGKLARPKTAAQVGALIAETCLTRDAEVLYGDAPGFLLRLTKLMPGLSDWALDIAYRRRHPLGRGE
jgi:uncharacterized protein